MTDRRQRTHAAPRGLPDAGALSKRPHAVVVGAGIAGLAAATGLAERGVDVTVIEREHYLGGRVGGWIEQHDGTDYAMNRGFHAFFRQYYNLRELLSRIDPQLRMLTPVDDYPLIDGAGRRESFRRLPHTPPWNALVFALRSPTFRLRDLVRLDAKAAAPLAAVSVPAIYEQLDHIDADTFLKSINFPSAARHLAFEVFSRSFFADPSNLSAAELATMFHIYFLGSSEGLVFDVPTSNYDTALWEPLRRYLHDEHGGRFCLGVSVTRVDSDSASGAGFGVHTDTGDRLDADAVVLAADIAGLQRIVAASPDLGDDRWRTHVRGLQTAPPFAVHRLWLDRPVAAHRPAFMGAAGHAPLDNISVLERYERESAQWAQHNRGSVVEVHAYALESAETGVSAEAVAQLHRMYPETASAEPVFEQVLIRDDCPLFAPGTHAHRPGIVTGIPGLVLAGDGIRLDLPVALMERAATTGWAAANALLNRLGVAGHALTTVPTTGRMAPLRWLAAHEDRRAR